MEITQVKETCLYITDIDHSYEFYHSLMGLPVINRVDGRHIFFRAGTSVLLCFIAAATAKDVHLPPHFGTGTLHLAFEVEPADYESSKQKLKDSGIEIIHEETWRPGIKSIYFHDPDGHLLEIVPKGMWDDPD